MIANKSAVDTTIIGDFMKNRIAISLLCGLIAILCAGPVFGAITVIKHDYGTVDGYAPQPGAFSETYGTYGVISDTLAFSDKFEFTTPDVEITGAVLELRFSGTQTENWWTIGTNPDIDIFKLRSTPDITFISQIYTFTVADLKEFYAGFDDHGIFTLTFSEKIKNSPLA